MNDSLKRTVLKRENGKIFSAETTEKIRLFFYNGSFVAAFIVALCMLMAIFSANGFYPFGNLSISWCDGDQQFIPLLCDFKDVLEGKSGFFMSTANSGGMNFYGVFFFNLSSPFSFLVVFFDKADMGNAFNVIVCLKLAVAAACFSFLVKNKTRNPIIIIFASVLYAFSGYATMYCQIAQWLDVYYVFPLLVLGLEKMTEGKSNVLYTVTLFLSVLFQFYLAYAVVIFVCLYASLYALYNRGNRRFCFSFIAGSVIAALCSCVVLLPCFVQYLGSMRSSDIITSLSSSNLFPPSYTSFPTFFCLAPVIVFAVYYFVGNYRNFKFTLFVLCFLPVVFEPIAKAWQTFNYMAFPARYGFTVITLGLYFGVCGIEKEAGNVQSIVGTDGACGATCTKNGSDFRDRLSIFFTGKNIFGKIFYAVIVALLVCFFGIFSVKYYNANARALSTFAQTLWGNKTSFEGLLLFAAVSAVIGALLFVTVKLKLTFKNLVFGAIGLFFVFEAAFSCNVYVTSAVTMRSEKNNISSRLEYIAELENLVPDQDFYRVKTERKLFEVNMIGALGYNSIAHYTSLNGRDFMLTAKALGYSSYWMEVNSDGGTIFSDALLRNKYVVCYGSRSGAAYTTASGKYSMIENEILFPSAFYVEKCENYSLDYTLERVMLQNEFFKELTGQGDLFERLPIVSLSDVEDLSDEENYEYSVVDGKNGVLNYAAKIEGEKRLYLDLFDEYGNSLKEPTYEKISAVTVYKNGTLVRRTSKYPLQTSNGVLDLGSYNDCEVRVSVELSGDVKAKSFGVYVADTSLLENAVNGLIGSNLSQKGNTFDTEIQVERDGGIFIGLPYDDGYTATVNGKKVDIKSFGGFMVVPVTCGKNVVELSFAPKGFSFGLAVSLLGVAAFALYIVFKNKLKKRIPKAAYSACFYLVEALGVFVVAVVYLFPLFVYLFV